MEEEGKSGGKAGQNLVSQLPATPHYNNAILEDMCMKEHLEALHAICGDSEAFRDAIILGKVLRIIHVLSLMQLELVKSSFRYRTVQNEISRIARSWIIV